MIIKFYENVKGVVINGEVIELKNSMEWLCIANAELEKKVMV